MFGLSHEVMCIIWFGLLGLLLTGYAVLDGFDLGVGIIHPFVARNDEERRISLNSIGPVWDGNEVWLVVFGGAMFAMFPEAYASIFSGFYLAFMLLLITLIGRAISIDLRSKVMSATWRKVWDNGFFVSSMLAAFLFGVAIGNIVKGIPLNEAGNFDLPFVAQLNPYSLLVGALVVTLFAMHGSLYLYLKTEGEFQDRIHRMVWRTFGLFMVMYVITTIFTLALYPHVLRHFREVPVLWILPVLHVLALANVPRETWYGRPLFAFLSSVICIASLVGLLGAALYPHLIIDPASELRSLSVFDASSSLKTLEIGFLFVLTGMPFVLAYTGTIYWAFRGKVRLGKSSY